MAEVPDGWQRLTCSCGQGRFAKVVHLRWRKGAGMTEEPGGYFCLECHGVVDSAVLIGKAEYRAKQQELRDLEAEMQQTPLPKTAPVVVPARK